jgi:predicted aconitase with swiveling domain
MIRMARAAAAGEAEGIAIVLSRPLSFWGGIDVETGSIIDHSHPDRGACVTGAILVMPGGRGSSSSASVFAESIRRRTGPAAIVLATSDPILTAGALVAELLYGAQCPVVVCGIDGIGSGDRLRVRSMPGRASEVSIMAAARQNERLPR